ncbi:hypothetical protein EVAR_90254_1 [Eumeta japonica]|uniref:Uncharacterized protein n=1 Tax=Eumeta variegata TaxID=151549 RepID=A0A4C2A1J1_EUMVA|nr:hypothetical protein EVAR_90254_1 [Eumeta japonica]
MQQPMNQIIQQFEEIESKSNKSQDILSDSPIYEPEEMTEELFEEVSLDVDVNKKTIDISENIEESTDDGNPKILKLEVPTDNTPSLDQEVSDIILLLPKVHQKSLLHLLQEYKLQEGIVDPGKIHQPHSEGYNYSDQSNNLSQPIRPNYKEQTTDLESTDTASSIQLDSPENMPTMASKMISKLSNGNSSTPSDVIEQKPVTIIISDNESDGTPDMVKGVNKKGKRNDSFRLSNNTTPSTISPLPNGHTMPLSTPQVPTFDIHWSK